MPAEPPTASPGSIARSSTPRPTIEKRRGQDRARHGRRQAGAVASSETDKKIPEFDGHHLQVYVDDFGAPHKKLQKLDLITEESDRCQYRFEDIVDLDTGKVLFQIEHEIRSMTHPLYARPLVNRNPAQTNRNYIMGGDAWVSTLPDGSARATWSRIR